MLEIIDFSYKNSMPTDRYVSNTCFFNPKNFEISIPRLKNVPYFVQSLQLPSFSINPVEIGTPANKINLYGDEINFGELEMTFLAQETLEDWYELWLWMNGLAGTKNQGQHYNLKYNRIKKIQTPNPQNEYNEKNAYDTAVLILQNTLRNPIIEIQFSDIHPISVSSLSLDASSDDTESIFTVSFAYDYYDVNYLP